MLTRDAKISEFEINDYDYTFEIDDEFIEKVINDEKYSYIDYREDYDIDY